MQKNINDTYSLLVSLFSFFLFFPPIKLYIYSIKQCFRFWESGREGAHGAPVFRGIYQPSHLIAL